MLQIENLMVFYENAVALNEFSMTVEAGEIVGVIGPNSAGKTTLMNTISGLIVDRQAKERRRGGERITLYGSVRFQGEEITTAKPSHRVKRGIVLCRERHPIFPESDVRENMKIAGYLRSRGERKAGMEMAYELFPALSGLARRKAGFLSGGEQQMLAISMALIAKPTLLLLDEPLLGLSPHFQAVFVRAISHLRETGITVLLAEQFARPILPIVDRGYVLENGMLSLSGTGAELMDNPEVKSAYFGV